MKSIQNLQSELLTNDWDFFIPIDIESEPILFKHFIKTPKFNQSIVIIREEDKYKYYSRIHHLYANPNRSVVIIKKNISHKNKNDNKNDKNKNNKNDKNPQYVNKTYVLLTVAVCSTGIFLLFSVSSLFF